MVINSHEPAKDRNKQNRENKNRVKKVIDTGKEKGITLETPKTEEQKVSVKKEGDGAEAPKKKKNIIRVYHAQNASDGGKNRKKPAGERKPRPQGTRPAAQAQPAAKAEAPVKAAPKPEAPKTEAPKPVSAPKAEAPKTKAPKAEAPKSAPSLQNRFRLHQKQKLQGQNPRDQLHSRTETTASSVREMARATVISVRAKAATIIAGITIVVTEMGTEADSAREDHRAARADSAETEIMMVREDL